MAPTSSDQATSSTSLSSVPIWRLASPSTARFGDDARTSAGTPFVVCADLTSLPPRIVDFQRDTRDFRPLLDRLSAGFTCRMFIGAEVQLDLGFDAVQARLANLVRGGLLRHASSEAYDEWQACLARIGPWVTAFFLPVLVQVRVCDMVTRADCATWTMRWEVAGLGDSLFPALDADIKLTPAGVNATILAVCGAYRPPLGVLGVGLDRAIMYQAAEVMIQSFTTCIRMAIVYPAASPEA